MIWGADIVGGQTAAATAAADANRPGAIGHVHRIIAISVGVHIRRIIHAIDGRIGPHPDTGDGVAAVILEPAGDVIGSQDGGEIDGQRLPGVEVGAAVLIEGRSRKEIIGGSGIAVHLQPPQIIAQTADRRRDKVSVRIGAIVHHILVVIVLAEDVNSRERMTLVVEDAAIKQRRGFRQGQGHARYTARRRIHLRVVIQTQVAVSRKPLTVHHDLPLAGDHRHSEGAVGAGVAGSRQVLPVGCLAKHENIWQPGVRIGRIHDTARDAGSGWN